MMVDLIINIASVTLTSLYVIAFVNENGLSKTSKAKWKKIVQSKISHQANQWYKTESSKLSKLQEIKKREKIIKREKYVT